MTADRAGTTILHYRILRAIGSGGMGVVYEADDTRLGRRVALKFLPPDLTRDPLALERFRREAQAASALNHPNICTIYAIEEAEGAAFIAMELLDGEPLDRRLAARPLSWDALIDTAIHVADALHAAHQRDIVHRDIKPANIFLTKDGRAKVLDFGVAKVAPLAGRAETVAALASPPALTMPGDAIGTVAYMSPEQACGDEVDARSDLFSLAALLYEMATGRPAFEGKTSAVIFQKILEGALTAPRQMNPSLPPKLEDIILRGLETDRELRYQSAADLRADLKRIKRDATAGTAAFVPPPPATGTRPPSSAAVLVAEAQRNKAAAGAAGLVLLGLVAAAGYGILALVGPRGGEAGPIAEPARDLAVTRLTSSGDVRGCGSISPDGKYVVYCTFAGELMIRQVATGATVSLGRHVGSTAFSPDGDLVYLSGTTDEYPNGVLWALPSLGGDLRRVATDLAGAPAVSPDGQRIAFLRANLERREIVLITADAFGGGERPLATGSLTDAWLEARGLSWSADGRLISATQASIAGGYRMRPVAVDAATGAVQTLGTRTWAEVGRTVWLPGNSGILFTARERFLGPYQFWIVAYPGGEARRLTSDVRGFGDYSVSVTADGSTIATVPNDSVSHIWRTSADGAAPLERWTSGARLGGRAGLAAVHDRRVYYTSSDGSDIGIWRLDAPRASPRRLTRGHAEAPSVPADGSFVAFQTLDGDRFRIYRMQPDGTDVRMLSRGDDDISRRVSPDGRWIYYSATGASSGLMRVAAEGGEPTRISGDLVAIAGVSPDGRALLVQDFEGRFAVLDSDSGAVTTRLSRPGARLAQWSPRAGHVVFLADEDGVSNLHEQPIAGGAARRLTSFTSGRIVDFAFSADGRHLFLGHGERSGDVVLIKDFR
jgi:eukaryotic-like serine/threonine-protein kinase